MQKTTIEYACEQYAENIASGNDAQAGYWANVAYSLEMKARAEDPFHTSGPPIAG